ncbi:MAG: dephospho-CoA kinase [Prevotella sp.]|nr:dephospho-CoA kinase [Prevotella sp.]
MKIAITGGIGSGKSYVCSLLERRGIRVYDSDAAAKRLMAQDETLKRQLSELVGDAVYNNGVLQKSVLAKYLLQSEKNKLAIDGIVHPAVARDFLQSGYEWLESAILFDSGFDRRVAFDYFVAVTAPLEVRIDRVMRRDNISREKTLEWIGRQMPQEEVARRCHFIIENDGRKPLDSQINELIIHINKY